MRSEQMKEDVGRSVIGVGYFGPKQSCRCGARLRWCVVACEMTGATSLLSLTTYRVLNHPVPIRRRIRIDWQVQELGGFFWVGCGG